MRNLDQMDLVTLRGYANELETFKSRVSMYCAGLKSGIGGCSKFMLDEDSQRVLQNGLKVAEDIKRCLYPVDGILEKVYGLIRRKENIQEYER